MNAIILAGGYAKRLLPLTKDTPKPLLEVGGKPILQHILEKVQALDDIEHIIISTNATFEAKFRQFLAKFPAKKPIMLEPEPSKDEGDKLGSIGGLAYLMKKTAVHDSV